MSNNLGNWFTCFKYSGLEPTNNFVEQAIREMAIIRKIIGAFGSGTGLKAYAALVSLFAT